MQLVVRITNWRPICGIKFVPRRRLMNLADLTRTSGEWLRGTGPESDIVISSRIRLARNLADFPFSIRASSQEKAEIARTLRGVLKECSRTRGLRYINVDDLSPLDRQLLMERQ